MKKGRLKRGGRLKLLKMGGDSMHLSRPFESPLVSVAPTGILVFSCSYQKLFLRSPQNLFEVDSKFPMLFNSHL